MEHVTEQVVPREVADLVGIVGFEGSFGGLIERTLPFLIHSLSSVAHREKGSVPFFQGTPLIF